MNISTRQLRAFVLIARLGNFTRAAEKMYITQAGLSVMMRELETQLDARLFDRTTRTVTLTWAGEKFLPAALHAIGDIEEAAAQINEIGEKARHTLKLAATPLVSSNLLPVICQRFRARYPEVTVRLVDCDLKQVHALVDSGEVDMGLGFFFKAARGIERTLLHSFQLMRVEPLDVDAEIKANKRAASSRGAQAAKADTVPWSVLKDASLIGLPPDNPIQQLVESHLASINRGNEEKLSFNHLDTLIAMVGAGAGTAIVPSLAMLACRRHKVRANILSEPSVSLGLYRITKRGRAKAHAMLEFTDTLISSLPDLMDPPKK
jgi:DNA-binding transcriptional LysR family regulator